LNENAGNALGALATLSETYKITISDCSAELDLKEDVPA
jgi:hypothetical protein